MPPDFNRRHELSARLRESLPMEVQTLAYTFQPVEEKLFPMVVVKNEDHEQSRTPHPDG